jgi:oligopeptidase A
MTSADHLRDNPILKIETLPAFAKIQADHISPALTQVLQDMSNEVRELERKIGGDWAGELNHLSDIHETLERIWGPIKHLNYVKNTQKWREIFESSNKEVVSFLIALAQNPIVYRTLKEVRNSSQWETLPGAQKRVIEIKLRDADLAGVGLSMEQREKFQSLVARLSELSIQFSNKIQDASKEFGIDIERKEDLQGLSPDVLSLMAAGYAKKHGLTSSEAQKGPWRVTLEIPVYLPVMTHCHNRSLRERLLRAFIARASHGEHDNTELMKEILTIREQKAQLLGFKNFAALSLASKMAPSLDAIKQLLEQIRAKAIDIGREELKELESLAPSYGIDKVCHWDIHFLAERLKEQKFQFKDEDTRPYFPMSQVLHGLFSAAQKLYGITVRPGQVESGVWDKDVSYYELFDEAGEKIAAFFLDPYSRPADKRGGAWMDVCRTHGIFRGKMDLPVAYMICNLSPPADHGQSLLAFTEVETLFHEFGHALHHMLSEVDFIDVSGTNGVEWDAIELPSMFMENWAFDRDTLKKLGRHFESGETIPDSLVEKIIASRTFRAASQVLGQLTYALTDLALHTEFKAGDPAERIFALQREISAKTSLLPMLPENRFLCSFSHIFAGGYAAGYYSYLWADVLACDAFAAFEEAGHDLKSQRRVGQKFRESILAKGGSQHPLILFRQFRGRDPKPEPFLRAYGLLH